MEACKCVFSHILYNCNKFNREIHTSSRKPTAVLRTYVNYCVQLHTNMVVSRTLHYLDWVNVIIKTLVLTS